MSLKLKRTYPIVILPVGLLLIIGSSGCTENITEARNETVAPQDTAGMTTAGAETGTIARPEGWSEESHGNEAEPNYDVVFPGDTVNQITITIATVDWEAMQANMADLVGEDGSGEGGGGIPGGFERPEAETAFYEVVLDYGEGPVSLGLYTMIEVIDDTVVERYFGSDDGNIYEADGPAASFAISTRSQIEQSFEKENNEDEADWSDIVTLFDVLHADQRTSDPTAWRADLESIFDVDGSLEWLAISAVIQHWDAYGNMSHNYYLYHDPDSGQLKWISWDHNMAMSTGMGSRGGRSPGTGSVSLDKAEVNDNWPLIRYLLDDPVYYALYVDYLAETVAGPFDPDHMAETYQAMAELIAPYAIADVGEAVFDAAVQQLIGHAYQRADSVEEFLTTSRGKNTP